MDGFPVAQVAEARILIVEARRRNEAEQLLIAQARVAVAQARLLLQRGLHFDPVSRREPSLGELTVTDILGQDSDAGGRSSRQS
jgi:hypothetical protein